MRNLLACVVLLFGCNQQGRGTSATSGNGGGGDGSVAGNDDMAVMPQNGALLIDPTMATLSISPGGAPATQAFTAKIHGSSSDDDVTSLSTFILDDPTIGSLSGATFITSGRHGGVAHVTASYQGQTATATITISVSGSFAGSDCSMGCPQFPAPNAPACASGTAAPTLVYPPDGVLLPPNMEQLSIHYTPAMGATEYEIGFSNKSTDVRVTHKCATQPMDSRGMPSGGCVLDLTPAEWDFIAGSNRGGDPIQITVRATPDGKCVTTSTAKASISIAEEDVSGAIYYWKSTISANGTGGQVWRKSFGDTMAEEQITNTGGLNGTCFGCHFLSRDGKRMTVNGDDDDSDDEYTDVNSGLVDIATKMFITTGTSRAGAGLSQPPGFQTFNPDHTLYLGSDGEGTSSSPSSFNLWNGDSGAASSPATVAGTGIRVTMPDWSADDKSVVFVVPGMIGTWSGTRGAHNDDDNVIGGSLWVLPHMGGGTFGAPTALIQSKGENNYYPSYSPDGAFVIFNRVDAQPMQQANNSFANPKARVWVLPTNNAMGPVDCAQLNGMGDLSNSWPRWSPFVQSYKGNKLLWVTFSSTRDYGVLVHNNQSGMVQCYPPDSYGNPTGGHHDMFGNNCKQPQLWMAAINLSSAEFAPADPSFPAFYLPFQDPKTHNHTAQWTTTIVNKPPPDAGTCVPSGADCTKDPNGCCVGICLATGTCGVP
jgi:hypothetical protein